MENLEELFNATMHQIDSKSNIYSEEYEKNLAQNINEIKSQLIDVLYNFRVSNRSLGNVEDKFFELKTLLTQMNRGQSNRMAEETIHNLKSAFLIIEEEEQKEQNIDEEEKEKNVNKQFDKVQSNVEERKTENNQPKNDMYIEETIRGAYSDIVRNIGILDARTIEEISNFLRHSCQKCIQNMSEMHKSNIDEITQMIQKEVQNLQQSVTTMENEKSSQKPINNAEQFMNLDDYRKPNPNDLKPVLDVNDNAAQFDSWDLRGYGKTPEEVNKGISGSIEAFNNRKPQLNDLPDNVIE